MPLSVDRSVAIHTVIVLSFIFSRNYSVPHGYRQQVLRRVGRLHEEQRASDRADEEGPRVRDRARPQRVHPLRQRLVRLYGPGGEFREREWKTPIFFWTAAPKTPNAP